MRRMGSAIRLVVFSAVFAMGLKPGISQALSLVGGLDLTAYCQSIGSGFAQLEGSTAYTWTCEEPRQVISVLAACRWRYGPPAVDRLGDYFNPYSWQCWR